MADKFISAMWRTSCWEGRLTTRLVLLMAIPRFTCWCTRYSAPNPLTWISRSAIRREWVAASGAWEAVGHQIEHRFVAREATIKSMQQVCGAVSAVGVMLSAVFEAFASIQRMMG